MSRKHRRQLKSRREQGFTLVNIAGLVVSTGLVFGAANSSYEWVSGQGNRTFYEDLKLVENTLWDYRNQMNRWPGDCDRDNVIGFHPANAQVPPAEQENNGAQESVCVSKSTAEFQSTPFNDLENAGLSAEAHIRAMFGSTATVSIGHGEVGNGRYNVIVIYDLSAERAQWLDREIDGITSGQLGRVRRWDQSDHGSAWPTNKDSNVAIAYYFDQAAPGK